MKKTFILISLLGLASCNDDAMRTRQTLDFKSDSRSTQNSLSNPSAATVGVGQITNTVKMGNTLAKSVLNDDQTVPRSEVNEETTAIVLKIEGTSFYEYRETRDILTGKIARKVVKKHLPSGSAGSLMKGSDETFTTSSHKSNVTINGFTVKHRSSITKTSHLTRGFCESKTETEEIVFVYQEKKEVFSDLTNLTEVSTCGGLMSAADREALSLSNIDFCDETTFGGTCEKMNLNSLKTVLK